MSVKWLSFLLLLQLTCYFSSGSCGKVLVWPMEYSPWMNMKTILDELVTRGNEVTVLTSSASVVIDPQKPSAIKFETFPVSLNEDEFDNSISLLITTWTNMSKNSFWPNFSPIRSLLEKYSDMLLHICKEVVSNKKLMTKLHESRFDIVLADAVAPCGELLAEILKIPFMYSLYTSLGYSIEKLSGRFPLPPSYVPVMTSELSDHMTFMERVKNMIYVLYFDFWFKTFNEQKWNQFYSGVLGRPTTLSETMGKAEIWLIRTYWDFTFPRPLLPNFEFVGGLHCKPAKPLPKEMEEFVQSSGENGIVVFTLGSMVSKVTEERANIIASAFAQIPQKVLWRYDGKKPDTLGPNTRLYKWIPQNDLLGHPKTKAFVTHGGSNGIYEAIYHGIPMVGLPLFADQPHNIAQMKAKGAAVRLDLETMTRVDFLAALKEVINNPSYKEKVMWLSTIQHDQPVKPLDRAVFWIEFVMRHKGAKHLRPAVHDLTWFQYHSLDVIGFLLACVASAVFVITKCCLFCYWKFAKTGEKGKTE
ncbi:UDP-glucuronosyltransferase 2B4-like [Hippopotamus amphibius kiboko]|uniref:UDP-glucuronosyltransferase 2B4-like n=1 Tax=Hippopotamus amphibius kiboko TaxID=575201 RepID=UPI002595B2B9|nr:UDP-glucuronosyltransferase 2B4-like [Hippopotamus amphibius kiboko]XP_057583689.1 UDP-glucuronosyltransferase 2B4-like [Hippopotamus amphibius kiboko]